jgi:hypothetical protein
MQDGPGSGGFRVPVCAKLQVLELSFPSGLDMGYVQVGTTSECSFMIKNTGQVDAPFHCDSPQPFTLTPGSGVVPVGSSIRIVCSVAPVGAAVYVSNACVRVGEGCNAIKPHPLLQIKLSCIAKFCHISASQERVDFDKVLVNTGTTTSSSNSISAADLNPVKEVVLRNSSVVPAEFQVRVAITYNSLSCITIRLVSNAIVADRHLAACSTCHTVRSHVSQIISMLSTSL